MYSNIPLPKYVSTDHRIIVIKNKNPIINAWSKREKNLLFKMYLKNTSKYGGFVKTIKEFSSNYNRTYSATKKNLYILIKNNYNIQ
jgi:hypothetical protein